jgi:CRP-like cAMP-binding protein
MFAMFFALNLAGGVGDCGVPVTLIELVFSNCCSLLGVFAFAYVIGTLSSILMLISEHENRLATNLTEIQLLLAKQNLSESFQRLVSDYYHWWWSSTNGLDSKAILMKLPDFLRSEVLMCITQQMIQRVSFFQNADRSFVTSVILMLEPLMAVPGEYIVRRHDLGTTMYFLKSGHAEVLIGDQENCSSVLESGDVFGEIAVLFASPRTASVRALTHCELFSLSKENLDLVMKHFPEQASIISRDAMLKRRRNSVNFNRATISLNSSTHGTFPIANLPVESTSNHDDLIFDSDDSTEDAIQTSPDPSIDFEEASNSDPIPSDCIFFVDSPVMKYWRVVIKLVHVYNYFIIPFRCAFLPYNASPVIYACDYLGDAMYMIDIWISSRTAFTKNGTIISDIDSIRSNYVSSIWFWIDLFGSVPFLDIIAIWAPRASLRLPRLLRAWRFLLIDSEAVFSEYRHFRKLAQVIAFIFTVVHIIACAFFSFSLEYGFSPSQNDSQNWLPSQAYASAKIWDQYMRSLFFSIAFLTATGQVNRPSTDLETVFSIFVMLIGKFGIAFLVGNVASILSDMSFHETQFASRVHQLNQFLKHHEIPRPLSNRIHRFCENAWSVQGGIDPNHALSLMPQELRSIVTLQIAGDVLQAIPMFAGVRPSFIRALAAEFVFETYPRGEIICERDHVGHKMFFIIRGSVEVIADLKSDIAPLAVLQPGSFFGEGALLVGKRAASIRAKESVQLLCTVFSIFFHDANPFFVQ